MSDALVHHADGYLVIMEELIHVLLLVRPVLQAGEAGVLVVLHVGPAMKSEPVILELRITVLVHVALLQLHVEELIHVLAVLIHHPCNP